MMTRLSMALVVVAAAIVYVALMGSSDAYAFSSTLHQKSFHPSSRIQFTSVKRTGGRGATHSQDGSAVTLYLLPTLSSISAGNYHLGRRDEPSTKVEGRGSSSSSSTNKSTITSSSLPSTLSSSVLSPTDTLPQFHTAHGLLSPEVFMRIADTYDGQLTENSSIHKFLKLYKSKGPMACLSMLSDDDVLPELTEAMREVSCIG